MKKAVVVLLTILMLFTLFQGALRESVVKADDALNVSIANISSISQNIILSEDTTWTSADSPYSLTNNVQIPYGVTLTIEPGTIINGNNYSIQVWGVLRVTGNINLKVKINNTHISQGSNDNENQPSLIDIQFAEIEGGSIYAQTGHSIKGSINLRDSLIKNTFSCMYLWYPISDCYIERNIFKNAGGISVGVDNSNVYIENNVFQQQTSPAVENWASYNGNTIVRYNSFLSNDRIALKLPPGYSPVAMIADHNYWNTENISTIESMIFDKNDDLSCAGYIVYTPFLDSPDQNTPSPFTIIASTGSGGTISPSGTISVNYGDSKTFTITPNPGYKIKDVKVDGVSVGAVSNYTFENITSDHTIEAIFEAITYTIIASTGSGGTISPSGTISVNYGDSKTFTITPDNGYKIKDVKVDGASQGSITSYTFTNITSDHTISATFEKEITQTVIILQIGNSTFTVNGSTRTLDSPSVIKNNRTLLPIRAVVEALDGTVGWDPAERKVTVSLGSTTLELWIGQSIAKVNGIDTPIDSANSKVVPEIINGRTMLPLRFVTESLGCDVQWDGTTKTITITYPKP
ncbi:MAG: copper amine oxidase N-terminal domain-containing protein [Bacteroidales bacterium]|nr:copper amine oxidase N-terminal domain-containing protein [Bacteroidales bacterium]